jgi:hypothetical protein
MLFLNLKDVIIKNFVVLSASRKEEVFFKLKISSFGKWEVKNMKTFGKGKPKLTALV